MYYIIRKEEYYEKILKLSNYNSNSIYTILSAITTNQFA